jgi:tetratricopeptide (TPR) repeat protein
LADIAEPAEKEDLYRQAFDKYRKATEIKPDDENAWNNWGVALCKLADIAEPAEKEDLYRQATGKYERATEIKPDNELALCGWGLALLELAARKSGDEREKLLDDAIAKFEQAERIRPGIAVYNLGCAYGLLEDKEKCRKWLEKAEQLGKLPTKEKADNDPSFVNVRNEDWFKQLNWKQQ